MRLRWHRITSVVAASLAVVAAVHPASARPGTGRAGGVARAVAVAVADRVEDVAPTTVATILDVSDWHGQLEPVPMTGAPGAWRQRYGGAAYLSSYFKQRAALAPNEPFIVTAGDEVGATQPISNLLGDRPAIEVMNDMGFDANTLGNHNFDSGVDRMEALARAADFPYVVSNLTHSGTGRAPEWVQESILWDVDGVKIGVTGAINEDAPNLVSRGRMGDLVVGGAAANINRVAADLRARGVNTVVALVHVGANFVPGVTGPTGPLIDLAGELRGVDLLIGDHKHAIVNQPIRDADGKPMWVVQNYHKGISFAEVRMVLDRRTGHTLSVSGTTFLADTASIEPDPVIQTKIDAWKAELGSRLNEVVGHSRTEIPHTLPIAESNQGNLVTDAMREHAGTDFAMINSGALRAALTDPSDQTPDGLHTIRMRNVYDALPFGDLVTTVEVTGSELKRLLENSVSSMPREDGRFAQVSGLRFGYHTLQQANSRVAWVTRPDGTPVDLSDASRYTVAMNDFMAMGGDSYPDLARRADFGDPLTGLLTAHIAAGTPVSPTGPAHPVMVPETRIFRLD
ncbi:MAG TPA: 5'-nucleotidase C-terminal domain-containing protein [Actinomycetota bacterium]|nr:5'-nucleotidase C-terminal domain-containing protein [Actinomycetota bacterium]